MGNNHDVMGTQRTVYVRESDIPLWRRAEEFAKVRRLAMSALIMTALEDYLDRHDLQPDRAR
jgi:predicted transcriptional regulator